MAGMAALAPRRWPVRRGRAADSSATSICHSLDAAHEPQSRSGNLRQVSSLGQSDDWPPPILMGFHRWGRHMHNMDNSVSLVGQVLLVVEDEEETFAQQLQAALEREGAKTMLARNPAHARDHVARFDFSAATIHSDSAGSSVEFRQLVKEMGSMPILLYGAEPPPDEPFKNARFVAISKASHAGVIVEAVSRLLSSSVPSRVVVSSISEQS